MKIVIDERETLLYDKCIEIKNSYIDNYETIIITKKILPIGDILITTDENKDIVIIERKTLNDLLASINDGRYEEQSHRLLHSSGIHNHNIVYLIEGGIFSLSFKQRKLVYSTVTSINHFKGMTVIKTANVTDSAEFILSFTEKVHRNLLKKRIPKYYSIPSVSSAPFFLEKIENDSTTVDNEMIQTNQEETPNPEMSEHSYVNVVKKVKKENLTPSNIGAVFLSQIPLISSVTANAIMEKYNNSLSSLIEELKINPNCLDGIQSEKDGKKRKIPSNSVKNIRLFLLGNQN